MPQAGRGRAWRGEAIDLASLSDRAWQAMGGALTAMSSNRAYTYQQTALPAWRRPIALFRLLPACEKKRKMRMGLYASPVVTLIQSIERKNDDSNSQGKQSGACDRFVCN